MGGPSAATRAARGRAAATPDVPVVAAVSAAGQAALAVLAGRTSDEVAAVAAPPVNRLGRKPKVTLPKATDVAGDIVAAVAGNLTGPRKFTTGSAGFFASGKSSFGELRYQCTVNVVLIGSNPKSGQFNKSFKVTIDLATAAAHVITVLPASLTATKFKSGADGFRINGRFTISDTEKYVVSGQAVRIGSK